MRTTIPKASRRPRRLALALLVLAGAGAVGAGAEPGREGEVGAGVGSALAGAGRRGAAAEALPDRDASGFADDASCAGCHGVLAESYGHVAMARSLYAVRGAEEIEDFERASFHHEASDRHYEMVRRDGELYCRRYQLDEAGERVNEIEMRLDWVVGSGNHSRSYLHRTPSGELYQAPVSWYSQTGTWGMSPGFDRSDHAGFTRAVPRGCLFCHNALPEYAAGDDRFDRRHVFPEVLPEGIGCQRCHGPGAEHVRLAEEAGSSEDAIRASILDPADLPPERRADVCLQCHLQPTTFLTSIQFRFDGGDYSFRPGDALSEHVVHLDFAAEDRDPERLEINHHAYRMMQSRCYTESGGALSCLTCHDPHRVVRPERRAAHYRAACAACHEPADCGLEHAALATDATAAPGATGESAGPGATGPPRAIGHPPADDCVACHMPERPTLDVPQARMTDHLVRRTPLDRADADEPGGRLREPAPRKGPVLYARPGETPDPADELYAAVASLPSATAAQAAEFGLALERARISKHEPFYRTGVALLEAGDAERAAALFGVLVGHMTDSAAVRRYLAEALFRNGDATEARRQLEEALELHPGDGDARTLYGRVLGELGETERALAELERAAVAGPFRAGTHLALGNLRMELGREEEGIAAYRRAAAVDPTLETAYHNLGLALVRGGRVAEGVAAWRHGVRSVKEPARLANLLALVLLTGPDPASRDAEEALRFASEAVELEPRDPAPVLARALALLRTGRPDEAVAAARAARALGADATSALLVEVAAAGAAGERERAAALWEEAQRTGRERPTSSSLRKALVEEAAAALR